MKEIGAIVDVEEVRKTGGTEKEGKEMVMIKLGNRGQKGKVMEGKRKVKDKRV